MMSALLEIYPSQIHLSTNIIEDVSTYWFYTHQILFFNNTGIDTVTCVVHIRGHLWH